MIDRATIDALRTTTDDDTLVVSLFLGVPRQPDEMRSVPARVKNLVRPLRERVDAGEFGEAGRALRADIDTAAELVSGHRGQLGRGVAAFVCGSKGLKELMDLPASVRDRAIIDRSAYLAPLEAMVDQATEYVAVVLDRQAATIFRFIMGELESKETISADDSGKPDYGGFSGYEEKNARSRADEVFAKLLRTVAARLGALRRKHDFDNIVIGGHQSSVEALKGMMHTELQNLVAGTFTIDPRTMTTDEVRTRCNDLVEGHQRKLDGEAVQTVVETAAEGGAAVVGIEAVLDAINQRAASLVLVSVDDTIAGARCGGCGWLSAAVGTCVACGDEMTAVDDIIDTATAVARSDGSRIRYLLSDTELATPQLGALTRFPIQRVG